MEEAESTHVGTTEVIAQRLEISRRELLDLGLRNPLLNYRLLRARGLEVVDEIPALVFRQLVQQGRAMAFLPLMDGEEVFEAVVRFRTVGDMSCTGSFESTASTLSEIIDEVSVSRVTERGASRADDLRAETAMEDRKKKGYF